MEVIFCELPYPAIQKQTDINDVFLSIVKEHTAGDPMDETKKWTNLMRAKIGSLLAAEGFKESMRIVFDKHLGR